MIEFCNKYIFMLFNWIDFRRSYIVGLISLVGINGVLAGISFLTTIALANHLGRAAFGDYSYAIAIGSCVSVIAMCGQNRTLVRDLIHNPNEYSRYVTASILLRAGLLILILICIVGANIMLEGGVGLSLGAFALIVAIGIKTFDLAAVYDYKNSITRHSVYFFIERCLYFSMVWIAILGFKENVSISLLGGFMLTSSCLGLMLQYRFVKRSLGLRFNRVALGDVINLTKRNSFIWLAAIASLSFGELSKVATKFFSGSEDLGNLAVAWQPVILASVLLTQITRIGGPLMARLTLPGVTVRKKYRSLCLYASFTLLAASSVGGPAILFPELILHMFFSPEYSSAADCMRILGAYVMVLGVGMVASQYLIAAHKDCIYSLTVILSAVLTLPCYFLFIPKFGEAGAALAVLSVHSSAMVVYIVATVNDIKSSAIAKIYGSALKAKETI